MTPEERAAAGRPMPSRLISTPMNANGAQPLTAHGIPQMATSNVAKALDRAMGANIIVAANKRCDINHAFCRSGRTFVIFFNNSARPGGGREVKAGFCVSGGCTQKGRRTELKKVINENTTRERLPTRPTSPRASFVSEPDSGDSYRKYVSPTHVVL